MIFQTKLANRRLWSLKGWDAKCKVCHGIGHYGALASQPDLIVFCKCAKLQKLPDNFDYAGHVQGKSTEDSPKSKKS